MGNELILFGLLIIPIGLGVIVAIADDKRRKEYKIREEFIRWEINHQYQ